MPDKHKVVVILFMLAVLSLTACGAGATEPPDEAIVIELLNQRDAVDGEYTFHNMNVCLVEADEVDIVEAWGVHYTRVDIDGAEKTFVRVVRGDDGEWSLSDRDYCVIR